MSEETIILTRRIQLIIGSENKDYRHQVYGKLYQWHRICREAANLAVSHCFVQEQLKELIYLTDQVRIKLADHKKDEAGILNCSKMNSIYKVLSARYKGEIPMAILTSLLQQINGVFALERAAYYKGERALRNYKKSIPMPFGSSCIRNLRLSDDQKKFQFNLFGIPFNTYLGRDIDDKRTLLHNVIAGTQQLCTSSLQIKDKKIYLLAAFKINKQKMPADASLIAEASLSIEYPLVVAINHKKYYIGNKEEFLYRRLAIQAARQRVQKASTYNRSKNGRKRKLKSLNRFEQNEKNYIGHKLHVYSRRLVNLCVKHGAATVLLTEQQEKEDIAKKDEFLLRNWSYYGLKDKIAYKAEKAGINVVVE